MIGAWIDEKLTDEQRDRIIEHPDPTYRGHSYWDDKRDCGCLVGSALGCDYWREHEFLSDLFSEGSAQWQEWVDVGARFPRLTRRFGAQRIWRATKARAGKRNRVELVQPRPRKRARLAARTS